jgi:DNA-binding response OmpR family regulator
LLELDGHHTQTAFCSSDALKFAESFEPDFMLLDIGLPRWTASGREAPPSTQLRLHDHVA